MNHSTLWARRLRELIGTDVATDEFDRLAHVDALLRAAAARDHQGAAMLLAGVRVRDCRPMNGRPRTNATCHPRTRRLSRGCERLRSRILAALDGELSEFEALQPRVDHKSPYAESSSSELRPYRPIHNGAEPQIGQVVRPGDVDLGGLGNVETRRSGM
jgi:hypothetical protein